MKHNIEGQEETVAALWDFARAVLELPESDRESFAERPQEYRIDTGTGHAPATYGVRTKPVSSAQLKTIGAALERVVKGFGYDVAVIQ